jgi:hypothetical protein
MFTVDDIDETLARFRKPGAQLVISEVVQYEDSYRLCYIRGPGGLLIGEGLDGLAGLWGETRARLRRLGLQPVAGSRRMLRLPVVGKQESEGSRR